jgi:signal transduction histidine kinase
LLPDGRFGAREAAAAQGFRLIGRYLNDLLRRAAYSSRQSLRERSAPANWVASVFDLLRRRLASGGSSAAPGAAGERPQNPAPAPIAEGARSGSFIVRADRRVVGLTAEAAAWFAGSAELGPDPDIERLHLPARLVREIERALQTGRLARLELPSHTAPDHWIEFEVQPAPEGVAVLFADVTERRLAEQTLDAATELLQTLCDAFAAEIVLIDDQGRVVSANTAWRASLAALHPGETPIDIGMRYMDLCRSMMSEAEAARLEAGLARLSAGELKILTQGYTVDTPEGPQVRQVQIRAFPVGATLHLIAIHEDLTDASVARAALRRTTEQLLTAQEEERKRIAFELHDTTSQHLVALGLGVAQLRRLVSPAPQTQDVLEDMAHSVQAAAKEIRALSFMMQPPAFDDDAFEASLRRFVNGFAARTGLDKSFRVEGPIEELDASIKHTVFRVVQEAMSNVYRHAEARRVDVGLTSRGGAVTLQIVDDGKGIESWKAGDADSVTLGVGIPGMRARVAQLGGALDIRSDASGTAISAVLPLDGVGPRAGAPAAASRPAPASEIPATPVEPLDGRSQGIT